MDAVALLARNVRALRKHAALSQEELAFRAGMKRSYLSDLERGARNPTVRALGRLADALGVAPSQLLDDRDLPSP
ncbi:helix-turn-helix domain-containing protein [Brevundimonas sp.]|jgi:transcriptional regulator with XRE-family HTH domain|uniref:helix-turn-helix domain-containing protein n=1 Tax=Brevundimonas sp. TaxID=1871086 RepID=UPI0037BFBC06